MAAGFSATRLLRKQAPAVQPLAEGCLSSESLAFREAGMAASITLHGAEEASFLTEGGLPLRRSRFAVVRDDTPRAIARQ